MTHRIFRNPSALILCIATVAHAAERPNIVVFLVDDMGLMDTSVPFLADQTGTPERHPLNEFYRTPGMERLAATGTRFETFYAMSVCSPTRVSLLTGQNAARHHTTQWIKSESNNRGAAGPPDWGWLGIEAGDVTLPALLDDAGYRTLFVGKAHFGPDDVFGELPQNFGFDVNIAGCSYGSPGSYLGMENFAKNRRRAVPGLAKYHGEDIFLTEALTREMNAEISAAVAAGEPFFAYMGHYAVHGPFTADERFAEGYATRRGEGKFATMIAGIDKSLGDMLDHLDDLGVAEDTLVFFLGDNGTDAPLGGFHEIACSAPLRGKKGTHYEGGTRVPFIASWAKPRAGDETQAALPLEAGALRRQAGNVTDLFPTIARLAGVDIPAGHVVDGADLSGRLAGVDDVPTRFLMHFPHRHRTSYFTSYREEDWKVVYHYFPADGGDVGVALDFEPAFPRYELYDLATDPTESRNLADSDPARLHAMMTKLAAALEGHGAQYPVAAVR
ncbi:MAG: sulfatase-like hydrolase/transferase, partial [Planctomycetota bacterium]